MSALKGGRGLVQLQHRLEEEKTRGLSLELPEAYISKVDDAKLSERTDGITTDLVGNVELDQGHVRRAKHGILGSCHAERDRTWSPGVAACTLGMAQGEDLMEGWRFGRWLFGGTGC